MLGSRAFAQRSARLLSTAAAAEAPSVPLLINGKFVKSASIVPGVPVRNPATQELLATTPIATAGEMRAAHDVEVLGMRLQVEHALEAQAAAVISKVRCSFLLPSSQPSPIPEESEGPFSPATPVAAAETRRGGCGGKDTCKCPSGEELAMGSKDTCTVGTDGSHAGTDGSHTGTDGSSGHTGTDGSSDRKSVV